MYSLFLLVCNDNRDEVQWVGETDYDKIKSKKYHLQYSMKKSEKLCYKQVSDIYLHFYFS